MDAEGNPKAVMSIMRDITEKKHYEMHLLQSEEKFRTLFQSAGDAIYLADLEGNIFEANEFACKILNYRRADLIKKNLADVISPGDIKPVQEGLRTMEMTGELNTEIVFVTKDGSQIPFDVRAKLIEYEGRKAVIGIVRDISERKKENAELKKAKEAAEKADKLKSEFLAQVSHEIRSPLNIVLNFSRLLRSELPGKIKPELIESFDAIDNAGERIVRTIDLLLNMAELQSGSYEPEFRTLDIYADIMENIYSEYKFHAEYKGLQLFLDKRTEETMVLVDDFSTTQILANLVDNAIKYTRKGKIELSVEAGLHNDVIVKVSDTGIGISKEYLPKMFEPFSQEEQGYTRSFEGSGLGLALVKKYCEINNVGIRCQSKKGKGTTFSIAFPKVTNRTINKQGQLFPI